MPNGKPANTPCVQLDSQSRCKIFGSPLRPKVCAGLQPEFNPIFQIIQYPILHLRGNPF